MDLKNYQSLVDEAKQSDNEELWVAECGYPADCPYEQDDLVDILMIIFEVAHNDVKSLVARVGQMTTFSELFRIPYRTVQDWRAKRFRIQEHVIRMIGYILITGVENKVKEDE